MKATRDGKRARFDGMRGEPSRLPEYQHSQVDSKSIDAATVEILDLFLAGGSTFKPEVEESAADVSFVEITSESLQEF